MLFLLAMCTMLIDGMRAQSIADVARQEREKRKEREKKQQEQEKEQQQHEKKRPSKTSSTPRVNRNESAPDEGELNKGIPLPGPSPLVPLNAGQPASPEASPDTSPIRSSTGSSFSVILLILGYGVVIVGELWMIIVTFKTGIWWGLGCLFIPLVELAYLVRYWKDARGPCGIQALGCILIIIALQIARS